MIFTSVFLCEIIWMLWTIGGVVNHPICNGIHREKHKLDCFILWIPHDHRMASCWKDVIICLKLFEILTHAQLGTGIQNELSFQLATCFVGVESDWAFAMFLPESAGFANLYCSHWRNWSNGRSQPTKNHSIRPSSQPVFPEPADPTHFWGGCSTILLSWWVIKVNCNRRFMCEALPWAKICGSCVNKKNMWLQIAKKNSESAGLSSSSSTFSAKMAHKMGHTIQLRDIPLVVSKQKLPIAHKKKPRHSTPAGGMNFRGNIREWGEVTWGLGDHRM